MDSFMDFLWFCYGFLMGFLDFRFWNLKIIENLEKNYEKYRKFDVFHWFFNDFRGFRLRKLSKSWKIDETIKKN